MIMMKIVLVFLVNWKVQSPVSAAIILYIQLFIYFYIAQIFYQTFPKLLDIHTVNFEVGVTPKVRTKETADAFIRSLIELQIGNNVSSLEQSNVLINGK